MWTFQSRSGDAVGLSKFDGVHSILNDRYKPSVTHYYFKIMVGNSHTSWLPVWLLELRPRRGFLFNARRRGSPRSFNCLPFCKDVGDGPGAGGHYEANQGHIFDTILAASPSLKNHV